VLTDVFWSGTLRPQVGRKKTDITLGTDDGGARRAPVEDPRAGGKPMSETSDAVDLADAITALRESLVRAMWDGKNSRVRFRIEPVDLTVQVGVTRTGKGSAGVKWHVLTIGGERSRESEVTQTLRLQLAPVLYDDRGNELPQSEQLISDRIDIESIAEDRPSHEPE